MPEFSQLPPYSGPYDDHNQEPDQCHEPDPADEADQEYPPDHTSEDPATEAQPTTSGDPGDDPTPPTDQPTGSTANAGIPPWERPHWRGNWGNTPSSQRGYPFRSSTPRAAGHGSQRVGNKLGKYNFKQRSRSGHRPRHPGPQPQQGPGWGIIAERDVAGDTPPNTDTNTDTKQATAAHAEHQQRSRESPYERWQREHHERAQQATTQQQHTPPPTATAAPDTQGDTPATQPSPADETQTDDTWRGPPHFTGTLPPDITIPTSSGGTDWLPLNNGCWEVVVKPTSIPEDATSSAGLPPLRTVNVGQAGPLATAPIFSRGTRGRLAPLDTPDSWLFTITQAPALDDLEPHSLFIVEGDTFRLELKPQGWLMTVETQAPSTARTIRQAQEHKAKPKAPPAKPKAPPPSQPNPPTEAKQQQKQTQPGGSDPPRHPPNLSSPPKPAQQVRFTEPDTTGGNTGTKQDTAAQAAHQQRSRESPYERWQREAKEREQHNQPSKPNQTYTKPGAQPERHPLLDGRPLRGNQPQPPNTAASDPQPQQQQPPPPKPDPFAAVRDGRTIGGGKRRPPTTTTTTTTTGNPTPTGSTFASTDTTSTTTTTHAAGGHSEGGDQSIFMQRSLEGVFHQQTTRHPPPPPQQTPQQLPQPPPTAAVMEIQQHVVTVASTQSDSPPELGNHDATAAEGGRADPDPIGKIEAQLSKIARLAQQLPGGGPIQALAESALTDLLLDSQTESQLLRDLEIEQTAARNGGHPAGEQATTQQTLERPTKQARTTNNTPAAAALQRIINKAQARMASTRDHIYISYYDIQHDIDIVLKWLHDYVHHLETGGRASTASSSNEVAPAGDTTTRQAVMGAMPALAGALYGLQHGAGNEHWQQLSEVAMMLSTVLNGGTISHPGRCHCRKSRHLDIEPCSSSPIQQGSGDPAGTPGDRQPPCRMARMRDQHRACRPACRAGRSGGSDATWPSGGKPPVANLECDGGCHPAADLTCGGGSTYGRLVAP